ncbi:hypothetical protein FHR29_000787 [Sphingobacterium sp. JUb56]|nr:hypothetical protein [Sphingobacterium sp. JUb56]
MNIEFTVFEINNKQVNDKPYWIDVMDAILNWSLKI